MNSQLVKAEAALEGIRSGRSKASKLRATEKRAYWSGKIARLKVQEYRRQEADPLAWINGLLARFPFLVKGYENARFNRKA